MFGFSFSADAGDCMFESRNFDRENERPFSTKWLGLSAAFFFAVLLVARTPSQGRAADSTPTFETQEEVGSDAVQGTLPDEVTQPEAAASKSTFETVDVPGAGTGTLQGTLPRTIRHVVNRTSGEFPGVIAGTYIDARSVYHGFYRLHDGRLINVDAPGAGSTSGLGTGGYGVPVFPVRPNDFSGLYLNDSGGIVGTYVDSTNHFHGFRYFFPEGGKILPFDIEGSGGAVNQGTIATGMETSNLTRTNNIITECDRDCLTGYRIDSGYVYSGFYGFDTKAGLSVINPMNFGGQGRGQGTVPLRIQEVGASSNVAPMIIGYTIDGSNIYHALTWYPTLSVPALSFDAPGAGTLPGQGTVYVAVDSLGPRSHRDQFAVGGEYYDLAGYYIDSGAVSHGFAQLARNGSALSNTGFDAPGAGTLAGQGTVPVDISPVLVETEAVRLHSGVITHELKKVTIGDVVGYYIDQRYVAHGFVRHNDGTIETFDAPGACSDGFNLNCQGKGTEPTGIDDSGRITGYYVDGKGVYHGFLRTP
jgi:hypothetical protein